MSRQPRARGESFSVSLHDVDHRRYDDEVEQALRGEGLRIAAECWRLAESLSGKLREDCLTGEAAIRMESDPRTH